MKKIAVIVFNLGGPESMSHVKDFLFNLFYDENIIRLIKPLRYLLAKIISTFRAEKSKKLYQLMGGKSPILENTIIQASKLEENLNNRGLNQEFKVLVAMRHSMPNSDTVIESLKKFSANEVILLPLYPQYSTTTTKSSFQDISLKLNKLGIKYKSICCYPNEPNFIAAHAEKINKVIENNQLNLEDSIILFSAHSIPLKYVEEGDPYQWQVEQTVISIMKKLSIKIDYQICYQSKVGRIKWLEPQTIDTIIETSSYKKNLVIVPIAFVSEHLETLVELDIEYKEVIDKLGLRSYYRVDALGIEPKFIESLAKQVIGLCSGEKRDKICPEKFCGCGYKNG